MHLKEEGDLLDSMLGKSPTAGGFSSASLFHSLPLHFPIHLHIYHGFLIRSVSMGYYIRCKHVLIHMCQVDAEYARVCTQRLLIQEDY